MIDAFTVLVFGIAFIGLILGSVSDLRTREIPDYLNFSLVILGFGIAALASLIFMDTSYIVASVLGFAFCFVMACGMFYSGQWGGGDAKMLMAMGALLGLPLHETLALGSLSTYSPTSFPFLLVYFVLIFFIGGVYGGVWISALIVRNWQAFSQAYIQAMTDKGQSRIRVLLFLIFLIITIVAFFMQDMAVSIVFFGSALMLVVLYFAYPVVKVVEEIAFIKEIPVDELTEGDWVAKDIVVAGKTIVTTKDLGVTADQLALLRSYAKKGKLKKVTVKYGIPFVPSFLIAFVVTLGIFYF